MFCSNCGAKAEGNFCRECGTRLGPLIKGPPPLPNMSDDWHDEIRYDVLLTFEEVRARIAECAAQARMGLSAEKIMELYDQVMKPITGVSVATVVSIALPIYTRLGVRTGKTRQEMMHAPAGKTMVAALCSLARHGWDLKHVHQGEDGCVLEALLPSDLRAMAGELVVTIHRERSRTQVDAATKIPGQLFDWGKSKQCLNELFDDLARIAA